jgi:hypothetical protein
VVHRKNDWFKRADLVLNGALIQDSDEAELNYLVKTLDGYSGCHFTNQDAKDFMNIAVTAKAKKHSNVVKYYTSSEMVMSPG